MRLAPSGVFRWMMQIEKNSAEFLDDCWAPSSLQRYLRAPGTEEVAHIQAASPYLPVPLPRSDMAICTWNSGLPCAGQMISATSVPGTE